MVHRIHHLVGRYINLIAGHEGSVLLIVLASLFLSAIVAGRLTLRSDLKELLPPQYESVKELDRVLRQVGGVGSLIVVAQSPDPQANKRFMDDLAGRISQLPPGIVRYVSYKADEIRKFYEDHFLYYIDTPDLEIFYNRLKKRIDYEKFRRTPLFFGLGDEGEDTPPKIAFDDIRERNERHFSSPVSTVDDYYGGEWGRMLIMVIRPYGATITIDSARALISRVEGIVDDLRPSSYDPRMEIGFCGNVKSTIEEYDTLKHDILSTALLCVLLVALSIVIYFLRIRVVFLLGATLLIAVAWTFAVTKIVIGYLNAQTAFLGSIIVGTGINYGIIVMARYLEERKRHRPPFEAMQTALEMTVRPTFLAAATTAVAFAVLLIARIRGLSQFGFIGAVGVILCWVATVFVLPAMTLESEKILRLVKPRALPSRKSALFELASRISARSPIFIIIMALIGAAVAAVSVWRFAPQAIEYDFSKMRNQASIESGTEALESRVSKLFKNSMTPSVVLVGSVGEGSDVCKAVMRQNSMLPASEQRVGSCHSVSDLLPTDQTAKLAVMSRIDRLLSKDMVRTLKGDIKKKVERIRRSILGRSITVTDLPLALTRHFEDLNGNRGAVVFINPRPGMLLSDGRNLTRFADTIRNIDLPDGRTFHAASEAIVFSDLVEIIRRDAPVLTLAALLGVILFVMVTLKKMRMSAVIIAALIWAVLIMLGLAAYIGIKINFFNFIVLPLTFGIGVDYGINMAVRIRQEGPLGVTHAIRHTGGAVVLCSVTTTIGYFVLTTATNQALATFGLAAVIGEITCIVAAIILIPAVIVIADRWRGKDV